LRVKGLRVLKFVGKNFVAVYHPFRW
jgi:hypothetical protein